MRKPVIYGLQVFAITIALFTPAAAWACSSCACGDPTLTAMGSEKPFVGRLRISALMQHRGENAGVAGVSRLETTEQRVELGAALQVMEALQVSLRMPLVNRTVRHVNLAQDKVFNIGDIDLRAKYFLYQDRNFSPRHLIAASAGMEFPTAPIARSAEGDQLVIEAQTGSGTFDPIAGLSYSYFAQPWTLYTSVTAILPLVAGRLGARPGRSLLTTIAGQYQPFEWFAAQLGLDARLDSQLIEDGVPDPHSGGFIGFISPGFVLTPFTDLLVQATVRIPIVQALRGEHTETVMINAGVVYDF